MLRDQSLIPFSHQHQHALALCVRIDRALKAGLPEEKALADWQAEIARIFATEIFFHFAAEEQFLFPEAYRYESLRSVVQNLRIEHKLLLAYSDEANAGKLDKQGLLGFAETLSSHIRREERDLFEGCQKLMTPDELARIGAQTEEFFRSKGVLTNACPLPEKQ